MNLIDVYSDREKSIRFLYELLKERQREPEYGISFKMPTMQQHRKFVMGKPYRYWYVVEVDVVIEAGVLGEHRRWGFERVGTVNATNHNEIGIHILKSFRGHGYGSKAVREFMALHKPLPAIPSVRSGCWLANIAPQNERSMAMFTKLGFKLKQQTYALESA